MYIEVGTPGPPPPLRAEPEIVRANRVCSSRMTEGMDDLKFELCVCYKRAGAEKNYVCTT